MWRCFRVRRVVPCSRTGIGMDVIFVLGFSLSLHFSLFLSRKSPCLGYSTWRPSSHPPFFSLTCVKRKKTWGKKNNPSLFSHLLVLGSHEIALSGQTKLGGFGYLVDKKAWQRLCASYWRWTKSCLLCDLHVLRLSLWMRPLF